MSTKKPAAQRVSSVDYNPFAMCTSKQADGTPCTWHELMSRITLAQAKDHAKNFNHEVRVVRMTISLYSRPDYDDANDVADLPQWDAKGGYSNAEQHVTVGGWFHARTQCYHFLCGLDPNEPLP